MSTMPVRQASSVARVLADTQFQINWQTVSLEMTAVAGAASYPVLHPAVGPGNPKGSFTMRNDSMMMGVYFSVTWLTAAAAEQGCIALAPGSSSALAAPGNNSLFFQTSLFCTAAMTGNQTIQRNPGFMFPPPMMKFVPASSAIQLFGSLQAAIGWRVLATVYFLPMPEYAKLMRLATG